ncbi:hypothetical protein GOALK_022_00130 [Gordonia alkanivorans NBRC 16433]|jgi:hypothetical protein|uniref:Uncharacterized protein n=1 Tax=Gordonia alkanivorans NBRC 16433 TaxID=1027371 RepID=F9VRA9_9ACTN|nr:hypothetical protein [Gordonia sp. 135]GAA11148.1 hypothetical protein GOALK_022_00130 [Gordonia alkanivorans NBRC 16433]
MPSTDYAQRAVAYWAKSDRAYTEGDPRYGDELAHWPPNANSGHTTTSLASAATSPNHRHGQEDSR